MKGNRDANARRRSELDAARRAGLDIRHAQRLAFMAERDLQQAVADLCRTLHLFYYHTRDSRGSTAGFPDCVIVGPRGVLWRELKTSAGRLSPAQRSWLGALQHTGANVAIWYPADLQTGRIVAELRALRGASGAGVEV